MENSEAVGCHLLSLGWNDCPFEVVDFSNFIIFFIYTVMAAASIANIVKSSLGPVGLDKMLVDDIGVSTAVCFYFT